MSGRKNLKFPYFVFPIRLPRSVEHLQCSSIKANSFLKLLRLGLIFRQTTLRTQVSHSGKFWTNGRHIFQMLNLKEFWHVANYILFNIFTKFLTHFWSLITILPFNSPDCRGNWISDTFLAWPKFNKMHEKMKKITNMAFIFWRLLKVDKRQVSLNRFKGQKLPKSQFHAVLPEFILWKVH